jgi:hypothetical protein
MLTISTSLRDLEKLNECSKLLEKLLKKLLRGKEFKMNINLDVGLYIK